MMRVYELEFNVRRGLGPTWFIRWINIALDDLDPETTETQARDMAIAEARKQLYSQGFGVGTLREISEV